MELHIKDRIYLPQLLPDQGSFMEFNLKRNILSKVLIKDEEREKYNIKEDKEKNNITWDAKVDVQNPLVVSFSEDEQAYLRKCCEKFTENDTPASDDLWVLVEKIYNSK